MTEKVSRRNMLKGVGASVGAFGLGLLTNPAVSVLAQTPDPLPPVAPKVPQASYRFKIGNFDAWVIKDGGFTPPAPVLAANAPESEVINFFDGRYVLNPDNTVDGIVNILVVNAGGNIIVFDTGLGAAAPTGGLLPATLEQNGVSPADVNTVILSHWHPDHVGGVLRPDGSLTYPNANYYFSGPEYDFLASIGEDSPLAGAVAGAKAVIAALEPTGRFSLYGDGDTVVSSVQARHTPGHTPGHMSFLISSAGESLMNMVDVSLNMYSGPAHPDWNAQFDADGDVATATRLGVFSQAAEQRIKLFGYHYSSPAIGYVQRVGTTDSFVWTPNAY